MKPDFGLFHRSDDTGGNETMSAVLDFPSLIMELFKGSLKRYAKKVVELLYCNNFDIEAVQDNLESDKSCIELVRASFSKKSKTKDLQRKRQL